MPAVHMCYSSLHECLYRQEHEIFFFSKSPRKTVEPQAFHLMGTGFFPWYKTGRGVKLTTYLNLIPRLPMSGITPLFPPMCLLCVDR